MPQPVTDARSNANDQIDHAVSVIGRSNQRRKVFTAIYHGKKATKTVAELAAVTRLDRKQVLTAGKALADGLLVQQTSDGGDTAYTKDPFYKGQRDRILRFVDNPAKLAELPTKTRPRGSSSASMTVTLTLPRGVIRSGQAKFITVDDIDSFAKVRKMRTGDIDRHEIPEADFKKGIQRITGEKGKFTDWGGETNDIWTNRVVFNGNRTDAALALKGPGMRAPLTPKKMGKNGDQIQRLFKSSATLFLVQFWAQIEQTVVEQMEAFARLKALSEGRTIYYGVVDGADSARIAAAYPDAFPGG